LPAAQRNTLLDHLAAGRMRPLVHARMKLAEAGRAQVMLESGKVIGKLLLKP
jgi:NADPH:quinone reductase-like Zn-dependent oxidoreductase